MLFLRSETNPVGFSQSKNLHFFILIVPVVSEQLPTVKWQRSDSSCSSLPIAFSHVSWAPWRTEQSSENMSDEYTSVGARLWCGALSYRGWGCVPWLPPWFRLPSGAPSVKKIGRSCVSSSERGADLATITVLVRIQSLLLIARY